MCPVYAAGKGIANLSRFLFHGFIRLWLRNSGLRPSDSLATTANFISWNNVIAADGLLMPSPVCIMLGSEKLKLIGPGGYRLNKRRTPAGREDEKQSAFLQQNQVL